MLPSSEQYRDPNLFRQGIEAARGGKRALARQLFREASRSNPSDARVWLWRASLAETALEAVHFLDEALALEPGNVTALEWMQKLRPEAPPAPDPSFPCPFCSTTYPEEVEQCVTCGAVLRLQLEAIRKNEWVDEAQLRHAVKYYRELQQDSKAELHYRLAIAHLNLHESAEAITHLRKVMEIDPDQQICRAALEQLSKRKCVLIVDDCLTVSQHVARLMEREQFRTVTISDSLAVLPAIESEPPDLVVLDVEMPVMNGYQLCKAIKSHPKCERVAVVMLSGNDGFVDKVRGRMAGASDYLTKPYQDSTIIRVLRKYLD